MQFNYFRQTFSHNFWLRGDNFRRFSLFEGFLLEFHFSFKIIWESIEPTPFSIENFEKKLFENNLLALNSKRDFEQFPLN
jgi:hypothetical protein